MLEDTLEVYLRVQTEKHGGRCDKCVNMSRIGWPDRTVQWPWLGVDLVELKKPKGETAGGRVRSSQTRVHEFLATCWTPVYLLDSKEKIDQYIRARTSGFHASELFSVPVTLPFK